MHKCSNPVSPTCELTGFFCLFFFLLCSAPHYHLSNKSSLLYKTSLSKCNLMLFLISFEIISHQLSHLCVFSIFLFSLSSSSGFSLSVPSLDLPLHFPGGSDGKESACRRPGFDPLEGRSPGEGNDYLLQTVFLPGELHGERSWWATVHGVAKSWTWLSD